MNPLDGRSVLALVDLPDFCRGLLALLARAPR